MHWLLLPVLLIFCHASPVWLKQQKQEEFIQTHPSTEGNLMWAQIKTQQKKKKKRAQLCQIWNCLFLFSKMKSKWNTPLPPGIHFQVRLQSQNVLFPALFLHCIVTSEQFEQLSGWILVIPGIHSHARAVVAATGTTANPWKALKNAYATFDICLWYLETQNLWEEAQKYNTTKWNQWEINNKPKIICISVTTL